MGFNVEEKTINVYGMKKSFAGYETNKITNKIYKFSILFLPLIVLISIIIRIIKNAIALRG